MARLRLDPRAVEDLTHIRRYLIERSTAGADRVRAHIAATLDYLVRFPRLGRSTDQPGVRVLPLRRYPYLVFYTLIDDDVVVLHIRHASRRPIDPDEL